MEQMDIYQGEEVVSRVVLGDGLGLDGRLGDCLRPYKHIFVVVDRMVAMKSRAVYDMVQEFISDSVPVKTIDVSETVKTMDTVLDICSWLLDAGADRDAMVLAAGGGITTDMVGFAASIYKRGVRFAYIPTTLLSQVDAAIGGKNGVNFEKYKNMLGVIRQPDFTYLCPQVLESLPRRDFLSGAAEMLKTFVINDGGMYERAVTYLKEYSASPEKALEENAIELKELIAAAAAVKVGVVSRDQFEKGERRVLNLGHTFAHAIESLAKKDEGMPVLSLSGKEARVTHGEAVAMGMILAARLAERLEKAGQGVLKRLAGMFAEEERGLSAKLEEDFKACGLPVECPYAIKEMAEAMRKDKKAEGGKVHFVVPRAVGNVEIVDLAVDEVVKLLK